MDPLWIATAFSAVNSIRVVFYLPQIVAVVKSVDGARDIALCTWAMWALTNGLGAAYGWVVVHDRMLAGSFALSLLACLVTIALTVMQRLRFKAAAQPRLRRRPIAQARGGAPSPASARSTIAPPLSIGKPPACMRAYTPASAAGRATTVAR